MLTPEQRAAAIIDPVFAACARRDPEVIKAEIASHIRQAVEQATAPPPPAKSRGEEAAEGMVGGRDLPSVIIIAGDYDRAQLIPLNHDFATEVRRIRAILAAAIDAEREAAKREERERCAEVARRHYKDLGLSQVNLTAGAAHSVPSTFVNATARAIAGEIENLK